MANININYQSKNKKILENILQKKLDKICKTVKLTLDEWDVDEELYEALKESEGLEQARDTCIEFNAVLEAAAMLKVQINTEFYWFKNLEKLTNK